jgi:hypothetical protein
MVPIEAADSHGVSSPHENKESYFDVYLEENLEFSTCLPLLHLQF